MSISKENIVLSLVIFSHGCEEFGREFSDPDLLNFYTNKVRVFSRACVPGISSVTSPSNHLIEVADIMKDCQSKKTIDTKEILCSHMTTITKPKYISDLSSLKYPTLIPHQDKSCNVSTFLHNKTFDFVSKEIISSDYFGIFVVDVRKQIIYDDGTIKYELIFKPGTISISNVNYYNLIDKEAMKNIINVSLKRRKTAKEITSLYNNFFSGNKSDLTKIYNFCIECGIDYLNILDNSCRVCSSGTPLHPYSIDEIYNMEQSVTSKKSNFGGKKSKKLIKKSKKNKNKKRTRRTRRTKI
jgi:hypothetical protein